jgi:hypothetical protein
MSVPNSPAFRLKLSVEEQWIISNVVKMLNQVHKVTLVVCSIILFVPGSALSEDNSSATPVRHQPLRRRQPPPSIPCWYRTQAVLLSLWVSVTAS